MRVAERVEQLTQIVRRGQQPPVEPFTQLELELVKLANPNAAALRHEDVSVEDVWWREGRAAIGVSRRRDTIASRANLLLPGT